MIVHERTSANLRATHTQSNMVMFIGHWQAARHCAPLWTLPSAAEEARPAILSQQRVRFTGTQLICLARKTQGKLSRMGG